MAERLERTEVKSYSAIKYEFTPLQRQTQGWRSERQTRGRRV